MKYHIRQGTDAWRCVWAQEVNDQKGHSFRTTKNVTYTEKERLSYPDDQWYVFELPYNREHWKYLMVRAADVSIIPDNTQVWEIPPDSWKGPVTRSLYDANNPASALNDPTNWPNIKF